MAQTQSLGNRKCFIEIRKRKKTIICMWYVVAPGQLHTPEGGCGVGPSRDLTPDPPLGVEATKVFDVPRVRQLCTVARGQPNGARPGDADHSIRTLPHW